MSTRRERLSELLRIISEAALTPEDQITVDSAEEEFPVLLKQLNSLLDDEFVAGYDYHADPTAPLLPGRSQKKQFYGAKIKRGPGRPRKNPELPPRPSGKHVSEEPDPDAT